MGNFGGSSHDDLAIGVDGERLPTKEGKSGFVGAVHVLYGSDSGLSSASSQFLRQGVDGMRGRAEAFDSFGSSLAAGNFGRTPFDDLAIGSHEDYDEDYGDAHGNVQVVYGSKSGLLTDSGEIWHQSKPGVRGKSEPGDHFGGSLTVGDFDLDGFEDLAAGGSERTTVEGFPGPVSVGSVNILRGSPQGLTADGNQIWKREAVWPDEGRGSGFGWNLTAGDIGSGPQDDLVVSEGLSRDRGLVRVACALQRRNPRARHVQQPVLVPGFSRCSKSSRGRRQLGLDGRFASCRVLFWSSGRDFRTFGTKVRGGGRLDRKYLGAGRRS